MKKALYLLFLVLPISMLAQPAGYYSTTAGTTGEALRTALRNIIRPHTELSYTPGLWNAYYTTDAKPTGKIWDVYSDRPGGAAAYEYALGSGQCGSVTPAAEGTCYNREHTWPQSKFASTAPMQTDLFIVYPTDYLVNSSRGDLPYGKVGSASQTFTNGGRIGNNAYPGAPSGNCYEPIDSFKGDLARNYFYVVTCYKNDSSVFTTWETAIRTRLKPWAAQMLLEWHHLDPVSKKEIDRNNAVYTLQGNRNPFIDRPEFADCIWGTSDCTFLSAPSVVTTLPAYRMYPNPATHEVTMDWDGVGSADAITITVRDISGRSLYMASEGNSGKQTTLSLVGWPAGLYFVQITTQAATVVQRLIVE